MTDDPGGSTQNSTRNGIIFFDRLQDEALDEASQQTSGVLNGLFGRFWKSDVSTPTTPTANQNIPTETTSQPEFSNPAGPSTIRGGISTILSVNTESSAPSDAASNSSGSAEFPLNIRKNRGNSNQNLDSPSNLSIDSNPDNSNSRRFSDKLTTLLKGNKPRLQDYNRSNFRQYWMPDSTGKECYQCEERFTTFRRRHHCRVCGQIFCSKCCNIHFPGSALGYLGDLRLCHYCAKMMSQYLPADELSTAWRKTSNDESTSGGVTSSMNLTSSDSGAATLTSSGTEGIPPIYTPIPPIATVSAGNLMWAPTDRDNGFNSPQLLRGGRDTGIGSVPGTPKASIPSSGNFGTIPESQNRRASFSLAPPTNRLPAMLSVEELLLVQAERTSSSGDSSSDKHLHAHNALQEDDESGPDWLRGIDSGTQSLGIDGTRVDSSSSLRNVSSNRSLEQATPTGQSTPVSGSADRSREEVQDKVSLTSEVIEANEKMTFDENGLVISEITTISPSTIVISRNAPIDVDTNAAFAKTAERLLDYLFEREQISDKRWKEIVLNLADKIANRLTVDVQKRDSMNILDYVHIKKLHVDVEEPKSETIWGVVCSKNLQHKEAHLEEPRQASIMIVAGSIEYERIQGKLSSIEPIMFQEAEYLAKQVDRILARRPTLLLVEGGVSRIAAELLKRNSVKLAVNVKSTVLQRVARCTGADILPSSDAQLIQQSIGFCPQFCQKSIKLADGSDKILLILDKCPDDRNCSVILKGNDAVELKSIKKILQMLILSSYSSRLEKEFLNLFGVKLAYSESPCAACTDRLANIENKEEKSPFEEALHRCVLSSSPFIEYEPPFLETPRGRACSLLPYFKQPLYRFGTKEDFEQAKAEAKLQIDRQMETTKAGKLPSEPREPFAKSSCVAPTDFKEVASFRALSGLFFKRRMKAAQEEKERIRKKQNEENMSSGDGTKRQDVLDPSCHQRVAVLFGSFSPKSPNAPYFCVRPWVVSMQFYGDHDMTLGEFLTRFCFNKSYECPSSNCEVPMLDHSRKLVFGRVCIEVTTQTVVQSGEENNQSVNGPILTWYYCPSCKLSSNVMTMSPDIWHLSFGRYLDYLSNSSYSTGSLINTAVHSQQQQCTHCFFHETTHFFSMNNFVTTFKVSPIRPYHVQFSPILCTILPTRKAKQDYLNDLLRLSDLFESLAATASERLQKLSDDHDEYVEKFHSELVNLVEKTRQIVGEKKPFIDYLQASENEELLTNDALAIKSVETRLQLREVIYDLISAWNEQCGVLSAHMRALKNSKDETQPGAEMPEISIEKLDDPFPAYLHLGLRLKARCGVTVRDIVDYRGNYKPDIGSIIAYALSSADYEENRRKQREAAGGEDIALNLNSASVNTENEASQAAEHIEVEFQDTQASYYVKAYYGERFRLLRKLLFPEGEEAFIRSLSETQFWTPQGGKSGSFFYKTCDHRFIIKTMSNFEVRSFVKFAPNYFEYVKTAVTEHKLTTLCKVFGVFKVGFKNKTSTYKGDILVMEYLFYNQNVNQVWDLKGSLRNRLASTGKNTSDLVLLDENFVKDLWNQQLYVYPHAKAALNQAISNDSHFLSAQYVMDYSLLVGLDEKNGQLIFGIVDYMRTYTLDKKLESWVKIVAIPGAHLPTILSPEMYCTRFSEAIDNYFPVVPDQWTGKLRTQHAMSRNKKKEQEEEAMLKEQLSNFERDFGGSAPLPTVGKTFIRVDIVNANQSVGKDVKPELYKPTPTISLPKDKLPVSASSFEDAKKLAAERARRYMEEAMKGKGGPAPTVIPPPTKAPAVRPPKPGSAAAVKDTKKISQLESFKMELQKIQEERDKRKGIRDQLVKGGIDAASVDRIAPILDKPYLGGGEFDDDPFTTNLYVGNLAKDVTMNDIYDTFGSYGPLASAKILYPRNEEENCRQFLCGFVAYMSRVDVDRAMTHLPGVVINDETLKMSFAKPVPIPVQPFYIPPPLQELTIPDPPTGLPFNAMPLLKDLNSFVDKYGELPPLMKPLPDDKDLVHDYYQMLKNATVRVVIPTDSHLLTIIHRTVEFVVKEGPLFEAIIMSHEAQNPMFRFLYDNFHPAHVYYRWRIYSIMNGDTLTEWRMNKFRIFENGSWWQPPVPMTDLLRQMPESLYYFACHNMNQDKYFPNRRDQRYDSRKRSRSASDDEGQRRQDQKRLSSKEGAEAEQRKKKKYLSSSEREAFEDMLRGLTPEKDRVGDAMVWCCEHATCAKEICECIYESLTIDETPLHKKIARLYLISDILANCAQRGVRDVFYFRQYFGDLLEQIFEALGKAMDRIEARLKKEQFKQRIMACFSAWEDETIYPNDVLIKCQNIFLGLVMPSKSESEDISLLKKDLLTSKSDSEDEDIDGAPIEEDDVPMASLTSSASKSKSKEATVESEDDDDIDGVPLESAHLLEERKEKALKANIFEDESDSDDENAKRQVGDSKRNSNKLTFKPAFENTSKKSALSQEPLIRSKWDEPDDKSMEISGRRKDDGATASSSQNSKANDSDTDGEIDDLNDPASILANASAEEERRKMMREIEIKVMALQDELEASNDKDIKKKVADYRKKEMDKIDEKLVKKIKKREEKKKDKEKDNKEKEKKKDKEKESSNKERSRRDDERRRSRSRDRDRASRTSRDGDRDRDRRRERSRSRDRKRSSSRDRSRRERSRSKDRRRR